MGPRVKKPRTGKAKDSPTAAEAEREVNEGGDEKRNEETESQEDVHKTEVDNGGEDAPPLKKVRGRQNVKKVPAKGKGATATPADKENADEGTEKLSDDTGVEENSNKVTSDNDEEETAPAKKGRGRTKKVTKDEMVAKDASSGEGESKEDLDVAAPGAKRGRSRKKKVDDDIEVMPKKKDRGAKKNEAIVEEEEEAATDEGTGAADAEESKQKTAKREKKQPTKRAGKGKKDNEEEKSVEEEEINGKKSDVQGLEEKTEDDDFEAVEEGAGDSKPAKKTARGKAANKTADDTAKKKPAGRGKKAAKGEELTEDDDVPVDGKKLRVLVEHCKS